MPEVSLRNGNLNVLIKKSDETSKSFRGIYFAKYYSGGGMMLIAGGKMVLGKK